MARKVHGVEQAEEIVLGDGLPEERITLLRSISFKSFGFCHFINTFMECFNYGWCKGQRNIADSHTDDFRVRVRLLKRASAFAYFRE